MVKKQLFSAILLSSVMLLNGCAGLFIAGAATTANVVTDKRSTQQIWQDNNIELDVVAIGNKAPYENRIRLVATSYEGDVVLLGQVPTPQDKTAIEQQVKQIKGVKTIHNQLEIKKPLSLSAISHDSWITTKIKSSLLTNSELNGVKVKVVTEDKKVYLFGYVTREQAKIAVDIARNTAGVEKVLRAFKYGTPDKKSGA